MRLRFTPRAVRDLSEIGRYLLARNPQGALRVRAAILESIQNLLLFPKAGRRQKIEGVRKIVARRYPYLIYYSFDENSQEIAILTIRHPAQEREFADR